MSEVSLEAFAAAHADGATVIDVREPGEYVGGHVPGAVLMPMGQLPSRLSELDRDRTVYVICAERQPLRCHDRLPRPRRLRRRLGRRRHLRLGQLAAARSSPASARPPEHLHRPRPRTPTSPARTPMSTATTTVSTPVIVPIDTPTLGDRSYLAHDGSGRRRHRPAARHRPRPGAGRRGRGAHHPRLRDPHPQRLRHRRPRPGAGHRRGYHVNAADDVSYDRTPISDGDVVEVSADDAGPRHRHARPHLHAPVLRPRGRADAAGADFEPVGVFTGGSLLFGATGRPDLLGHDHTHDLVHHQFASAHRLADELPEHTHVLPTHGFGSFCSAGSTGDTTASTIGAEKRQNPALTQDEERWVADTLAGLDAYPAYYAHMAPANSAGPGAPDLSAPETADKDTLAARIAAGEWVVDLRTRTAFAAGHVTGTLNFGLDGQFATYLGWLIPWGTPLTLLGDTPEQVAEAQRELVRIGIDHLAGRRHRHPGGVDRRHARATSSGPCSPTSPRSATTAAVTVLDVRRASEYDDGHIDGAVNIPLHELLARVDEVPAGEVWVHCAGGYRASIAASVLAARGIPVVAVDDSFDENAASSGLPITASRLT